MDNEYKFEGWMGLDKDSVQGKMHWQEFEPKTWTEDSIDIKITHSGVCGSDIHTLQSGWGPAIYPLCVGHEIVGHAYRIGNNVKNGIKVGDRVGVGAQSSSCLKPDCEECTSGKENYCTHMVGTYNDKYEDGSRSQGGYSTYHRAPSHFVIKIPDAIASEDAAPMLCGGVTTFRPLKQNGCGPGKKVGIVGIGGLGHFGVLFAKALGADRVVGISRSSVKKADVLKMGADDYIATDDDLNWAQIHARSLDLIVCTVSSAKMPLMSYLQLLRTEGTFIQIGEPEEELPRLSVFAFIAKGCKMGGSMIGSPSDITEMLEFAAEKKVKPWIVKRPMREANQAIVDLKAGNARYRYTLVN
ncbi:GroES-like protein [Polychaeton citri CBS 116435]|uniref:alcohol dehydrogenase (NADP(+)) n=1 Tax=Polychaeton citri CBS 116435 TaxID=1314669 RepID=A0A9P4UKP1_9PEZI|nr:GroES-like protein [Polychaeton citri CBS 116435]